MRRTFSLAIAMVLGMGLPAAPAVAAADNQYTVHPLVSSVPGAAPRTDPNLVNGWGLTASATSPWWVADNGTSLSTIYRADGSIAPLVVQVPVHPTGAVFWATGPARFVFDTEAGQVRGWPGSGTQTVVLADRSAVGAIYKGLALATTAAGDRFYATDFHNGRVDVFDATFNIVMVPGAFTDPNLPAGYAPFGVQTIGSRIFVTYAKQDADAVDEIHGQGKGFVDAFDTSGMLLTRVAQHGQLDAPWGLALAPANFGRFSGDLLVGNFGDGKINAYEEMANGRFEYRGALRGSDGMPISIDGLWALQFGHGTINNGPTNTLFFTAGPNDESDGLFGSITTP
ncbi:MAG TPA: TIGR03118 family protein [Candidatus Limnocylindria bacterium]|nr:TIGR03118 family protein [Candidatus Limnocylindria bacterium]